MKVEGKTGFVGPFEKDLIPDPKSLKSYVPKDRLIGIRLILAIVLTNEERKSFFDEEGFTLFL